MRKLVLILYVILTVSIIITIVTGNFSAGVIKFEALIFIAITIIGAFLPKNSNNQNQNDNNQQE